MATRDLAVIGIRLIALYLVARGLLVAVQSVPYAWAGDPVEDASLLQLSVLLQLVMPISLAALLWLGAPWLANAMSGAGSEPVDTGGLTAESVAAIAFGVAGTVVLLHGLPQLIWNAVQAVLLEREAGAGSPTRGQWLQVVVVALRCVLAFGVVVGARALGRWVLRLRTLGLRSDES
ncbi:hypothetical protein C84B14_07945 [Salinisphaera sp. C84B14]|uniref:hypothetical protein n=1 Tax=Salinisphaera sp. C84B14 TaxID=1304155 RepID=UPI00334036F1